jgi:hypothetical protein
LSDAKLRIPTEGAHYYDVDGTPRHTIIGTTTGRERKTTVRDAKKHGWLPSVTTVLRGGIPQPRALENWRLNGVVQHALTTERRQDESDEEYLSRIVSDWQESMSYAPDVGSEVHAAIAHYLDTGCSYVTATSEDATPARDAAIQWCDANVHRVLATEHTVVDTYYGFAGTVDAIVVLTDGTLAVVDWKTQTPRDKTAIRDEWLYQHAAYSQALMSAWHTDDVPASINVVLPLDGREAVEQRWSDAEVERGWQIFRSALRTYRLLNRWEAA